jgi:hypothetical protein
LPRPHITWFKDGIELYAHKFFQVRIESHINNLLSRKLETSPLVIAKLH